MNIKPLISILMPFRNTAQYLEECLDSIIDQSYENWELLAINDRSEDESLKLVKKYVQKDPRVKVFQNEGKGIIPALQLALKHSSCEYITRMDSDDVMTPIKLEELLNQLLRKGRGYVSTGQIKYFSEGELGQGYIRYAEWLNELTAKSENFREIYKECIIPSPCWMLHRDDLNICGDFDSSRYPEDYDLCFRLYENNIKCTGSNELLHYWRDHSCRASRIDKNYADFQFYEIKLDYFLKLECPDEKKVVLWSAGKKGKIVADHLIARNIDFKWVCTNEKMIGNRVKDIQIEDYRSVVDIENPRILIPIVSQKYQTMILDFLSPFGLRENREIFFIN
ncbi:MAG: glycosyltransferase family 2 protein [Proteobacteria bacterium]|nr:glycosyltransferase family 2 protein [Pseudomonadota bacterium]